MAYYDEILPIEAPIPAVRQNAKRHYGVHPYFTRRPYNVVRKYILHYSRENDRVLDPFGGSGVTAIEAFLENRIGIHNDINPLANFIALGIADLSKGNPSDFISSLASLKKSCQVQLAQINNLDQASLNDFMMSLKLPPNINLPTNADVKQYWDLFTRRQLVSLTILKDAIEKLPDEYARKAMLLAWSATLAKLNKTFLSAEGRAESRGGSSIFSIYRYKIANKPIELPPWETFNERAMNIIVAKEEIDKTIELKKRTRGWSGVFEVHALDIDELSKKLSDKVDYIFTDPPYGGHISYLDLSILWNSWLGFMPKLKDRKKELIVGGELKLSEIDYIKRLSNSIRACLNLLKPNRWFSVVFQHWNIKYFEAILLAAEEEGGELRAAIPQVGDPIWSMHKKKNKESVLAGELILTFFKTERKKIQKKKSSFYVDRSLKDILTNNKSGKIFGEYLFNRLIIEAWNSSSMDFLNISRTEFRDLMNRLGWYYHPKKHYWVNDKSTKEIPYGEVDR